MRVSLTMSVFSIARFIFGCKFSLVLDVCSSWRCPSFSGFCFMCACCRRAGVLRWFLSVVGSPTLSGSAEALLPPAEKLRDVLLPSLPLTKKTLLKYITVFNFFLCKVNMIACSVRGDVESRSYIAKHSSLRNFFSPVL